MNHHFDPFKSELALTGRLTIAVHGQFRTIIDTLKQSSPSELVIDLGETEFVDSAGLGMLLVAREAVAAHGATIRLRNARGQVERMLDCARFGELFTLE